MSVSAERPDAFDLFVFALRGMPQTFNPAATKPCGLRVALSCSESGSDTNCHLFPSGCSLIQSCSVKLTTH